MATVTRGRKLAGDVNGVFGGGLPDWLSGLIGDNDDNREKLMGWLGDMFNQWTNGKKLDNEQKLQQLTGGHYLSQRQKEDILNPEDKATRIERLEFKGGFTKDGRWTTSYDAWVAGGKHHAPVKPLNFGPQTRTPLGKDEKIAGADGKVVKAGDWAKDASKKAGGDYRGVKRLSDGTIQYTFGDPKAIAGRSSAVRAIDAAKAHNETNDLLKFLDSNVADVGEDVPKDSVDPKTGKPRVTLGEAAAISNGNRQVRQVVENRNRPNEDPDEGNARSYFGKYGDIKGGQAMRERGWLDAVFNGGLSRPALRQATKGGRAR